MLLDVGCGPGSLTLPLAPHVAQAIGVDADPGRPAAADRLARAQRLPNTRWRLLPAAGGGGHRTGAHLPGPRPRAGRGILPAAAARDGRSSERVRDADRDVWR